MTSYSKEWYKCLKKQIDTDLKMYKGKKINHLDKLKLKKSKKHMCIIIENNIIKTDIPETNWAETERRFACLFLLIKLSIKYSKNHKLPPINGEFYFRIADGYDFEFNYPTFNYSKPKNKLGFIYPDFNFLDVFTKIDTFKSNCSKIDKINKLYFKGSSTSVNKSKIREKMSKFKAPFNIKIDNIKSPYYNICKYKYVFDLPGVKPWSVRLIELYMSKSLPIRILLYNSKWGEDIWVQFFENMFPPLKSYAGISYDTDYDKPISPTIIKDIETKCLQVYDIYNEKDSEYNKIVKDNFNKINALRQIHLEYYMYYLLMSYNKVVKE